MRISLSILLVLFVLISLGAQKFGHLDRKALLAEMSEMKAANSELAALKDKLQKKGEVMVAALQDEFARIQHLISYANLTPDALGQLRTEMDAMLQEVYLFEENMKSQLVETEANLKQPIFDKVNTAIAEVAEERGLQYIFDQGTYVILFAEESTDVTSLVKLKM